MTTLVFYDDFIGTGNIADHVPQAGFTGSMGWINDPTFYDKLILSDGSYANTMPPYPTSPSWYPSASIYYGNERAYYGANPSYGSNLDFGISRSFSGTLTFRTGPEVGLAGASTGHLGVFVSFTIEGAEIKVGFSSYNNGPEGNWRCTITTSGPAYQNHTSASVSTVTPNTDYILSFEIYENLQTVSIPALGITAINTVALGTTGRGLGQLEFYVSNTHSVGQLSIYADRIGEITALGDDFRTGESVAIGGRKALFGFGLGETTWSTTGSAIQLTTAGGTGQLMNPSGTAKAVGFARLGVLGAYTDGPSQYDAYIKLGLGPNVELAGSHPGWVFKVDGANFTVTVSLTADSGGVWHLQMVTTSATGSVVDTAAITIPGLVADELGDLVVTNRNGAQTAAYTNGNATYTVTSSSTFNKLIGLSSVYLSLEAGATAAAFSIVPFYEGAIAAVAPMAMLFAAGSAFSPSEADMYSPMPTLYAQGSDATGLNDFNSAMPAPTLAAYGGANALLELPYPTLSITATIGTRGVALLVSPSATIAATGTGTNAVGGMDLAAPAARLVGYSGAVVSITLSSGPTLVATGSVGGAGGAYLTLPLFELVASGTSASKGSASLLMPAAKLGATAQAYIVAPSAQLVAIGTAVVAATYEAYALNLNHQFAAAHKYAEAPTDELTRYTNFPFTQIVRYQNSYFGVAADGLYLLEGTTDDGVAIPWNFQTAFSDFGSPNMKTLEMAYFGGRFGPSASIELLVGEVDTQSYVYTTPRDGTAANYRQPFGRGLKARYYAVAASGTDTVAIDTITFNVATLARKV